MFFQTNINAERSEDFEVHQVKDECFVNQTCTLKFTVLGVDIANTPFDKILISFSEY